MEDKILELVTKMYSEFIDFKNKCINNTVEKQAVEIRVIQGGKK